MAHSLPKLNYKYDALEPFIDEQTMTIHHSKHHQAYVNNLNGLVEGSEFADKSLEDIVTTAPAGGVFNNAAQVWNHTFYWNSMKPGGGGPVAAQSAIP